MTEQAQDGPQVSVSELLADAPRNWGKWGPDDEVGSLNYLTQDEVLAGVSLVKSGKVFTLQVPMADPEGDPVWPGRTGAKRFNYVDRGYFLAGKGPVHPGGLQNVEDYMTLYLHGSTQYDALGHVWYDDLLWNGHDPLSTIGGMSKAGVLPIAERGVVGRGVLLDIARFRGKDSLSAGETFDHTDLLACAASQGVEITPRSILLVRTGWIGRFFRVSREEFYRDFSEPGLTYSPELVRWFQEMEIPNLVTDTIGNEVTHDPATGIVTPLHCALMRNLGVVMTEIAWLDDLAADCSRDGRFEFLYTAAPLKIVGGSGAPVNPVVLK